MHNFDLPPDLLRPAQLNRHSAAVECGFAERWRSVLAAPGIGSAFERVRRGGVGQLVGRFYPHAGRADLELLADYIFFLFMWDDFCDEGAARSEPQVFCERNRHALAAFTCGALGDDAPALAHMLVALYDKLRARMSGAWLCRFAVDTQDWLEATVWEASDRRAGTRPSVDVYVRQRRFASAIHPCLDLIELAAGIELPIAVRSDPDFIELGGRANNIIGWTNDVFSFEKEAGSQELHNLVLVLANARRLAQRDALEQAIGMVNGELAVFAALGERLRQRHGAPLHAYVDGCADLVAGNLDWSMTAPRYRGEVQRALRDGSARQHVCQ